MTRTDFLKICATLGISLPFQTIISSCNKDKPSKPVGKVLILGAGAAGLSAGHLLKQSNVEFQILEANATYGGRMKKTNNFVEFPIPLGAEWLHVGTNIFSEIVNDNAVSVNVDTVGYQASDSYGLWENGTLTLDQLGPDTDRKFVNGSWFDFFETYVAPSVASNIVYNAAVLSVDYSGDQVVVKTQSDTYTADKVIVTIPLKILQSGSVAFKPVLPDAKVIAIATMNVWNGIKVFIEFSEKFYPVFTDFKINPQTAGQVSYYDAAYGQNTTRNILGLFAVGTPSQNYTSLHGDALKSYILNELDHIFNNQASPKYIRHMVQNWNEEPFINAAYLSDYEDAKKVSDMFEPVADKVYFAGEAYTSGDDWGGVHAAAQAAKEAVKQITN